MGPDLDGQQGRLSDGGRVDTLIGDRRFQEAEALLERLRQQRQDDPTLALRHGQCLHELGRLEEAVPCYLRAMAGAPSDPEPLRLLGLLLEQAGDADQAEALYRQAIAVGPDCIESLFSLGRFLSNQARIDEARPLYEAIERLDPQHPAAPFSIGRDARQLGEHDLALEVLGSFNQLAKLGEATLDFWAAALAAVPEAQLLIKDRHTGNPSACRRLRESLERRGIDPDRLRFLPAVPDWQDHLRAYNGVDIALDATPWSGSSTAFDAVAMGVPLVAIRGDCPSARMSASVLSGLDRREWISDHPTGFAAIVADLARDLPGLRRDKAARQRQALSSGLHDPHDLGRHVGDALVAMHRLAT
jgi:tetratricopeptide (TPR) repeat protein